MRVSVTTTCFPVTPYFIKHAQINDRLNTNIYYCVRSISEPEIAVTSILEINDHPPVHRVGFIASWNINMPRLLCFALNCLHWIFTLWTNLYFCIIKYLLYSVFWVGGLTWSAKCPTSLKATHLFFLNFNFNFIPRTDTQLDIHTWYSGILSAFILIICGIESIWKFISLSPCRDER